MEPFQGYRITSPYGYRIHPVTGKRHFHTGIDLVKWHRAPIYAFVEGQVLHAGTGHKGSGFGGFGIVVAIRDKKDHLHCYVHLDEVSVAVGDYVTRNTEIGLQGNTGTYTTGSHLHYEIRKTYTPAFGWVSTEEERCVNPTQYLKDYYEEEAEMEQLQRRIAQLEERIKQLEALHNLSEIPEWAAEAVEQANTTRGEGGQLLVDTKEGGSMDFYRMLTILHRAGVLKGGEKE